MLDIKEQIISDLKRIVKDLTDQDVAPSLEHPKDERHGDYSSNIAMALFQKSETRNSKSEMVRQAHHRKQSRRTNSKSEIRKYQTPLELAQKVASNYQRLASSYIDRVEAVAPGFINFWLSKEYLMGQLKDVLDKKDQFGKTKSLENKKIMVEFADPNTHKEMHIGHMRTLITGEALSRILEEVGAKVFRANYQGDIGPHVAKAIFGVQKILEEKGLTIDKVEKGSNKEKAHFLGEAYVRGNQEYDLHKDQIDGINARLYTAISRHSGEEGQPVQNDESIIALYKLTRKWSLDYYDEFYKRFYTKFDKLFFESEMVERGKEIVEANLGTVFRRDQGAIVFKGEPYGLHTRVFVTQAGYPTYEGKEMANAFEEHEAFHFDKKIHVVASEQAEYFKVVFKALELIDSKKFKDRQYHIPMGMVHLAGPSASSGQARKMSSRTGDVLTVDWLINKVKEKVDSIVESGKIKKTGREDVAEEVAIGAIKYFSLKVDTKQDISFDIEKSVSLDGNSGPYLQYTYARTQSVVAKRKAQSEKRKADKTVILIRQLTEKDPIKVERDSSVALLPKNDITNEELSPLRILYRFPEVVEEAAEKFAPNIVCNYLFDLSQKFNLFYQTVPIIKQQVEKSSGVNVRHPLERKPRINSLRGKHSVRSEAVIGTSTEFRLTLTMAVGQIIKNGLYLLGITAPERM